MLLHWFIHPWLCWCTKTWPVWTNNFKGAWLLMELVTGNCHACGSHRATYVRTGRGCARTGDLTPPFWVLYWVPINIAIWWQKHRLVLIYGCISVCFHPLTSAINKWPHESHSLLGGGRGCTNMLPPLPNKVTPSSSVSDWRDWRAKMDWEGEGMESICMIWPLPPLPSRSIHISLLPVGENYCPPSNTWKQHRPLTTNDKCSPNLFNRV